MWIVFLPVIAGIILFVVGLVVWVKKGHIRVSLGFTIPLIKKDRLPLGACLTIFGVASVGSPLAYLASFCKDEFLDLLAFVARSKQSPDVGHYECDGADDSAFEYQEDHSILDLRPFKHVHCALAGIRVSPAYLTNAMQLKKVKNVRWLKINYGTSNRPGIDAACLDHPYALRALKFSDIHPLEVSLCIDTNEIQVNQTFSVTNTLTYWNAFNSNDQWWFETYTNKQPTNMKEQMSTAIIFPTKKPAQNISLCLGEHVTNSCKPLDLTSLARGQDSLTCYWSRELEPSPDEERTLRTNWLWPKDD